MLLCDQEKLINHYSAIKMGLDLNPRPLGYEVHPAGLGLDGGGGDEFLCCERWVIVCELEVGGEGMERFKGDGRWVWRGIRGDFVVVAGLVWIDPGYMGVFEG